MAEALAALGLYSEDEIVIDDDEFWLWPESVDAFRFWCSIQTQWVVGMAGRVGLNYPAVESCMRLHGIPKKKQPELFGLIQAMESAVLEVWAEKR